jgi:hypothetical protein
MTAAASSADSAGQHPKYLTSVEEDNNFQKEILAQIRELRADIAVVLKYQIEHSSQHKRVAGSVRG